MLSRSARRLASRRPPSRRMQSLGAPHRTSVAHATASGTPIAPHTYDATYVYIPNFVPSVVAKYVMSHLAWPIQQREQLCREHGVVLDDLRDEMPDVVEAEKRLPKEEMVDRMRRRKRAGDLSLKHVHLPKDNWPTQEEMRRPYLSVPIQQVRAEWQEMDRFADVLEGKAPEELPPPAGPFGYFPGRWYKLEWDE